MRWCATITKKDGNVERREHLTEFALVQVGFDWANIKGIVFERELDPEDDVSITMKRATWEIIAEALCRDTDYYEQSDEIKRQLAP